MKDRETFDRVIATCTDTRGQRNAAQWLGFHGDTLIAAEQPLGTTRRAALLHFDTRSDNVRLERALLRIFDWPFACVGPPEFDFAAFAQSVTGEDGPAPELLTEWYGEIMALDADRLAASAVAIAGFFAVRGSSPDVPGLPRLRAFQRLQFRTTLRWAARLLGLPPPTWLGR